MIGEYRRTTAVEQPSQGSKVTSKGTLPFAKSKGGFEFAKGTVPFTLRREGDSPLQAQ